MSKLKIGVIGCGGIANQKHFPALKNNSDLNEVIAFCDIIKERAQKAAEEYGVPGAKVYTDYKELLANKDVEVVHICTPNVSHKDPPVINDAGREPGYIVRRLTATECARLQGFPDWWCSGLGTENPTEKEMAFWRDVFEARRRITGTAQKPKTDKQITRWLKDPHSDSAEYKMWGNAVYAGNVYFVLSGIVYYSQFPDFLL